MVDLNDKTDPYDFKKLGAVRFERHHAHFCKLLESLVLKGNFDLACSLAYNEAQHYKHLAQIDGIREEAKRYSQELLLKSKEYGKKTKN